MNCINPVLIPIKGTFSHTLVPCGNCWLCRSQKRQEWTLRIGHEYETCGQQGAFVTLTYDNEHCPPELVKKDLQDFFKRFRTTLKRKLGFENTFKYYACGEYGDTFGRPHYHFIGLGVPLPIMEVATKMAWTNGFVKVAGVTNKSIGYVCGYTSKKMAGWRDSLQYRDKQPPFQLQSQGLGYQWALAHKKQISDDLCIRVSDKEYSIPRYYLKRLWSRDIMKLDLWKSPRTYDEQCQIDEVKDFYERLAYKQDAKEYDAFKNVSRETDERLVVKDYLKYQNDVDFGKVDEINKSSYFNSALSASLAKHESALSYARVKCNRIDDYCSLYIKNYFKRITQWKLLDKYIKVVHNELHQDYLNKRGLYAKTKTRTQRRT